VSNRTGESRNGGAKKCSEVGHWRDHMRSRRKPCRSSLFKGRGASLSVVSRGPMGRDGAEPRQRGMGPGKPYELRASRFAPREEAFRW
jgi:hypothetical protein